MPPKSLLVADDSALARRLIRNLLATKFDQALEYEEAADGTEAVQKARELHPDVVIMDIAMPHLNGVEAARHIIKSCPEIAVLTISLYDPTAILPRIREVGIRGFVSKASMDVDLVPAIETILEGKTYFATGHGATVAQLSP
jgi:DNA-binding NarL/FixJ family response regulator